MIPTGLLGLQVRWHAWVPIDDEHMMLWNFTRADPRRGRRPGRRWPATARPGPCRNAAAAGSSGVGYLPDTSDWMGKFRLTQDPRNDYMIDREAQAARRTTPASRASPSRTRR